MKTGRFFEKIVKMLALLFSAEVIRYVNFFIRVDLQYCVNFLLYSIVTQSYMDIHAFSQTVYHPGLSQETVDRVPRAGQQDLMAYPFSTSQFASVTPNSPSIPLPLPPSWRPQACSLCL